MALGFEVPETTLSARSQASDMPETIMLFAGFRALEMPQTTLFARFRARHHAICMALCLQGARNHVTLFVLFRASKVPETTLFAWFWTCVANHVETKVHRRLTQG